MSDTETAAGHPLAGELALYRARRADWVREGHEGRWVVVHGDRILGFFPTVGDGFAQASRAFAPGTFLVKRVTDEEQVHTIQQVCWQ